MTYHNAVKFIKSSPEAVHSPQPFDRIKRLCDALGNPEKRIKYLRLAGSNGKTVCAEMLMSALSGSAVSAGCLFMPLREDIRENIRIGADNLSIDEVSFYITKIHDAIVEIRKKDTENEASTDMFTPTRSEILLAFALLIFNDKHCSLCIIEGDHNGDDPSKFLPPPFAAIICGTIPSGDRHEITRIQSYITKGILEIISAPQDKKAFGVISATCASVNCRLSIPSKASMSVTSCTLGGTTFSYKGKEYSMGLCGKFQLSNAEVALETIEMLIRRGFSITYEDVKKGFASIRLKSKFEILSLNPIIIADSTHKAVAISTVCDSLLDFKSLTGNKICLCLPEGQIVGEYISSLEERGYNIQKIFTTATHPEDPLIFPCPTPKAMAKEALSFTTSDMILLISGQYDFTDKLRREILAKLNF
ncbi:MAG: hypothetical protein J6Q78_04160 [Clostridia bacterium]|nr:hypothetical protein [Clostridia bacterium]